jgi:thiamine pyrophosphokinase
MGKVASIVLGESFTQLEGDVFGVDKGAWALWRAGIPMRALMGDFDSIDAEALNVLKAHHPNIDIHPSRKDQSDSQIAIEKALSLGYQTIHVHGALGRRLDHQQVNLQLAYAHPEVVLHDAHNRIETKLVGTHVLETLGFTHVSFFAYQAATLSLENFAYTLDHATIDMLSVHTLSNHWLSGPGRLIVHAGRVLVMRTKD